MRKHPNVLHEIEKNQESKRNHDQKIDNEKSKPPPSQHNSEAGEQTTQTQHDDVSYNLIHVSDYGVNKFIKMGRISVRNGHLYMDDSEWELEQAKQSYL